MDSVVLGFLAERRGYGYELGKRIGARMGPGWQFNPSGIYASLDRLEERNLVRHEQRESRVSSPRSRERTVYSATEEGVSEFEQWLRSAVRKEPVRMDVLARIAVSRPEHAGLLLEALDGYERECLDMIAGTTGHDSGDLAPWDRLIDEGVRESVLQHLRAELTWVKSMRRRIEAFGESG
ncbi:MAG: PadR family transcriptional regulator [Thermoleophilaceae bacterium]